MTGYRGAGGVIGLAMLVFAYGCGGDGWDAARAQAAGDRLPLAAAPAAEAQPGQVLVRCEPHQQTLVRTVAVRGEAVTEVECVGTGPVHASRTVRADEPLADEARIVPAVARAEPPAVTGGTVAPRPAAARPAQKRSVERSAVIIGSSAAAGAGVGALAGGKKGAIIGAAVGGGGAVVWDQATRRR